MEKDFLDLIKKTDLQPEVEIRGLGRRKAATGKLTIHKPNPSAKPQSYIISRYNGDFVMRYDTLAKYRYSFNYKTGVYKRYSHNNDKFEDTHVEVFAANFPHLIDVGIMGHCTHGQSGLCLKSGVQCYQQGSVINLPNMRLEDFRRIAEECRDVANQFALGGRGDPNEHENFGEILKICRENNIVPNYTTSGYNLTDEQIELTKKYCGAAAVSWYRSEYTINAINRFVAAGVKTNIHYVLNTDTIDEALDLLQNEGFPSGINAVVFLSHKPVGLGEKAKCLAPDDPRLLELYGFIKKGKKFKMGVDGSLVVGMINSGIKFNMKFLDSCEATRITCYIDAEMKLRPCSFDMDESHSLNLRKMTIHEAWHSQVFNSIREKMKSACPNCEKRNMCKGGCFLYSDIVLCKNKKVEELS